jgi:hypothetical protein
LRNEQEGQKKDICKLTWKVADVLDGKVDQLHWNGGLVKEAEELKLQGMLRPNHGGAQQDFGPYHK